MSTTRDQRRALEPLSLATIEREHRAAASRRTAWVDELGAGACEAAAAVAALQKRHEADRNFSTIGAAFRLCRDLLARGDGEEACGRARVVAIAEHAAERYIGRGGAIVEYDRCTWMTSEGVWFTIPWGTAFHGNSLADLYERLRPGLSEAQVEVWRGWLLGVGRWVYRNPIVDTIVFNCSVELLRLCWRLGQLLDRREWSAWAMARAHERLARDADGDGLFHAENDGVSGFYQLIGLRFLARFAWESKDRVLEGAVLRSVGAAVDWSTPTLIHPGNFGTRTSRLASIEDEPLLVAAALGDGHAAHLVRERGTAGWSLDLALWRRALQTPPRARALPRVRHYAGIDGTVFRHGPFVGWVANYARSKWARGFIDLWHAGADDVLFSTLHSLPTPVEWAKMNFEKTSDWAAFPHVRVRGDEGPFDSQQFVESHEVEARDDGLILAVVEELRNRQGAAGGRAAANYRFADDRIEIRLALSDLAGPASISFHLLRRRDRFAGFWDGENLENVMAGRLAKSGGWPRDRQLQAAAPGRVAVQIDQTLYLFELLDQPAGTQIHALSSAARGLHTDDHGGIELRLEFPPEFREGVVSLVFRVVALGERESDGRADDAVIERMPAVDAAAAVPRIDTDVAAKFARQRLAQRGDGRAGEASATPSPPARG